ncbi:MAG: hypothetical protein ACC631_11105 [Halocynthiibacter sp.]
MILVVGDVIDWRRRGRDLPQGGGFHFVDYLDLDRSVLESIEPDIVLAPLVGIGFDALDLAARLCRLGFRGRFRVLAPDLPNPDIVLTELRAQAPDIDCDLLQIDRPSLLRAN